MAERSEREWLNDEWKNFGYSISVNASGIKLLWNSVTNRLNNKSTANRELVKMNEKLCERIRDLEQELDGEHQVVTFQKQRIAKLEENLRFEALVAKCVR